MKKQLENELRMLMNAFDIPDMRRDVTKEENLRWLGRNLRISNASKLGCERAMEIIMALRTINRDVKNNTVDL